MDLFPLPLFPAGSLSGSVITTVWVGVLVVSFFNLRLGWAFSGLVVPGYLVPLVIAKPWSALLIVAEGFLTYGLVWLFSEVLSKGGRWSSLFGRDRFLALLLTSVAVRIAIDGFVAPWVGAYIQDRYQIGFDYRNNLHSFGLIIVALIANHLWTPGPWRGSLTLASILGITYVLVRYVLMDLTNFNIGNIEYLYEDMAASLLASPKAYMILLVTAFIASRMNLHYGWEFHGILVPSLLALLWYQPLKIVTSFAEAGVVFILGVVALQLPWLRRSTVEGARKTLLFFNISFAYKIALGYVLLAYWPTMKATDFYGFGYLLPTLMAIRAHDKGIAARLTRATLQVSLVSAGLACLIGFGLTYLPQAWLEPVIPAPAGAAPVIRLPQARLIDVLRAEKVHLYAKRAPDSVSVPLQQEIDLFAEAVGELKTHVKGPDPERLERARKLLQRVNFRADEVQERYLLLREIAPARGWGIYVLDTQVPDGLLVEVPAPIDEWGVLENGTLFMSAFQGSALAVAGSGRRTNRDGSSDVLSNPNTFYHVFHRLMARRNVLQVRGYTAESVRALSGERAKPGDIETPKIASSLWVKSSLPPGLNLSVLKKFLGDHPIEWGRTPLANAQRDATWSGFAELLLNRSDSRALMVRYMLESQAIAPQAHLERIDGYVQGSLLGEKKGIAGRGTDLYVRPAPEELLFLDEAVLVPLLQIARTEYREAGLSNAGQEELQAVAAAAALFDYRVIWYRHQKTGRDYLILEERPDAPRRRYWGLFLFRLGPSNPYLVHVPRPILEQNCLEYGVALFERLKANALLIAGANPYANRDGSADVVKAENKASLFNLVNQVTLREAADLPMMVVQSRGFGFETSLRLPPATDILVATADGTHTEQNLSRLGKGLVDVLQDDQFRVRYVDGSPSTIGYEVGGVLQVQYLPQTSFKEFAILWLSPLARLSYRQQTENRPQEIQFRFLEIPTVEDDLFQHLQALGARQGFSPVPEGLRDLIRRYHANQDIIVLHSIRQRWSTWTLERVIDRESKQSFLLVRADPARLPLVVNLVPRLEVPSPQVVGGGVDPDAIRHFIDSRAACLEFRETP